MRTIEDRFWSKVAVAGPDDCWEWQRSLSTSGYGQFKVATNQSPSKAHRVAWMLTNGDAGMLCVLHRCDNPPCCNPRHLFLGTAGDNVRDMVTKGRHAAGGSNFTALVAGVRRLTDGGIREARRASSQGESCRSIARRLGVHHTTISRLVRGQHWRGYAA